MEHRLAVVAADLDDLRRRLDGWLAGDPGAGVHRGHVRLPPGFPETRGDGAPDHTTVIARSEATTQSRAKTAHPGPGLLRPRQETPARNDGFVLASGPDAPLGDRQECVSAEASQPPPLAGTGPELAAHWCAGGAVDWRRLWPRGVPLRVALPTYPFAGERHWPLRDAAPDPSPPSPDVLDLLDDLIAGRVDATAASRRLLETEGTP
jgi:acyl transferase domain-containing protein